MNLIILLWVVVIALLVVGGFAIYGLNDVYNFGTFHKVMIIIVSFAMVFLLIAGVLGTTKLTKTESFKRFTKSIDSEFKGGIEREIIVHLENGDVIYHEKGKFDVEHSEERIKWVNEKDELQIIYLGRTSTAVVREIVNEK